MNNGLKRCPFCGGRAVQWWRGGKYKPFGYIECEVCRAKTGARALTRDYDNDDPAAFDDPTFGSLTEAWNNRVEEDE